MSTERTRMKFEVEELIKVLGREIDEIQEGAGPRAIRSHKLGLELDKERLESLVDTWKQGKPIIDGPSCRRMIRSLGATLGEYGAITRNAAESFSQGTEIAKKMGFAADTYCDKVVVELAGLGTGVWSKPDLMMADGHACDNDHQLYAICIANLMDFPAFFIDFPLLQDDKPTLADVNYIADQYGEFVEWAEKKVPGLKYDEAWHLEMLDADSTAEKIHYEIYKLTKHVPSPISPNEASKMDVYRLQPSRYSNFKKVIEYLKVIRDEMGERVATGTGPYPEERLRFLWAGRAHAIKSLTPHEMFLKRKVAMPIVGRGHRKPLFSTLERTNGALIGEDSRYGVHLNPLQEEAADLILDWWGGPGKRWVNRNLDLARDIGANGIIHHQLIGCTPMRSLGSMISERAEKELGIPVLNIEGRFMDLDYMNQEQFDERMSAFIDKCFDWAGKPRQ